MGLIRGFLAGIVFGLLFSMTYTRLVISQIVKLDNKGKSGNKISNFKKGVGFGKRLTKFYLIDHTKHFKKELKAWCVFRIITFFVFLAAILVYCLLAFVFELNNTTKIICYIIDGFMMLWCVAVFVIAGNSYGKCEIKIGK